MPNNPYPPTVEVEEPPAEATDVDQATAEDHEPDPPDNE